MVTSKSVCRRKVSRRLWLHRRTVSCVWWEQRMLDSHLTHFPMVTSKSVCRTPVLDNGSGPLELPPLVPLKVRLSYDSVTQTVTSPSDNVLCLVRIAHARFPSDTFSDGNVKVRLSYASVWEWIWAFGVTALCPPPWSPTKTWRPRADKLFRLTVKTYDRFKSLEHFKTAGSGDWGVGGGDE